MKKRIRPIWKLLFFIILFGIGYYFLLIKDYSSDTSYSVTNINKNVTNTKKESKKEEIVEDNKEEEIIDTPKEIVNTGLYTLNSNEVFNVTNMYLSNYRVNFKLNETINIYFEGSILDTKGEIYITPHNQSDIILYTLEYDNNNINGISFHIDYEGHYIGYYDIHVYNSNQEVALYVFQIVE